MRTTRRSATNMKTFEEFISTVEIMKVHQYSNSGATDYGVATYLAGEIKLGKSDKILFYKHFQDLTKEEREEYNDFLLQKYQSYCDWKKEQEERDQKKKEFIEKHKDAVLKIIPFSFTDHYEVFHLNCTDPEILKMSGSKQINTIEEFDDLYQDDKMHLIIMILNGATTIETWEDYILD